MTAQTVPQHGDWKHRYSFFLADGSPEPLTGAAVSLKLVHEASGTEVVLAVGSGLTRDGPTHTFDVGVERAALGAMMRGRWAAAINVAWPDGYDEPIAVDPIDVVALGAVNRSNTAVLRRIDGTRVIRASDGQTPAIAYVSMTERIAAEELARVTADTSLTTRLSTQETASASADNSLTTRLSTEEVNRAAGVASLQTRLSTEEVTRASADTSLTTRVGAIETGYLPLSGGVMTGALRVIAGVAAAVGLAVGADAGTGLYAPASQQVGIAAGGTHVATFEAGIATVAGVMRPDADATRDLGTSSVRWRDGFLSRTLQVGTSVQFGGSTASSPMWDRSGTQLRARLADGSGFTSIRATGLAFTNGQYIDTAGSDGWLFSNSGGTAYGYLQAVAANKLGLQNGTNASIFEVYKTSSAGNANYERLSVGYQSGVARIQTEKGGTGADTSLVVSALSTLFLGGNGAFQWNIPTTGHLTPQADATYDLASAAVRIRDAFFSRNVVVGGLVQIGGTSNLFPALKRVSTTVQFRLADDTGWANARMASLFLENGERLLSAGVAGDGFQLLSAGGTGVVLAVDANNVLALRSGTTPQRLNIYNTTDGTNLERAGLYWSSNAFWIGTEAAGTGTGTRDLNLMTAGTARWAVKGGGSIYAVADNTYDIGAPSANRARSGYFGTSIVVGTNPTGVASALGAFGQSWALIGGDVATDATNKAMRLGAAHYTNAEEPVTLLFAYGTSSASGVYIGGGSSAGNAATEIGFYTAPNNTTTTGTKRLSIDSGGHLMPGADATYKLGDNALQFIDAYISRAVIISQAAIPAGGVAGRGLRFSSTANFGIFFGSGAPTLSAAKGSVYLRSDGAGPNERFYSNTDGGTTWAAANFAA